MSLLIRNKTKNEALKDFRRQAADRGPKASQLPPRKGRNATTRSQEKAANKAVELIEYHKLSPQEVLEIKQSLLELYEWCVGRYLSDPTTNNNASHEPPMIASALMKLGKTYPKDGLVSSQQALTIKCSLLKLYEWRTKGYLFDPTNNNNVAHEPPMIASVLIKLGQAYPEHALTPDEQQNIKQEMVRIHDLNNQPYSYVLGAEKMSGLEYAFRQITSSQKIFPNHVAVEESSFVIKGIEKLRGNKPQNNVPGFIR